MTERADPDSSTGHRNPGDGFQIVGEETVFQGALITVSRADMRAPDGSRYEREIVHHPGAVVVVPMSGDDRVMMVRQYRAAAGGDLLEIPAGKRDVEGEPPDVTARRELEEEVGRRPSRLDLLARFYNSPGFSDELTWIYLARDLEEVPHDRQGAEEQHMVVEEIRLADVPGMIERSEIIDAKSIIGLFLTIDRLGRDNAPA